MSDDFQPNEFRPKVTTSTVSQLNSRLILLEIESLTAKITTKRLKQEARRLLVLVVFLALLNVANVILPILIQP